MLLPAASAPETTRALEPGFRFRRAREVVRPTTQPHCAFGPTGLKRLRLHLAWTGSRLRASRKSFGRSAKAIPRSRSTECTMAARDCNQGILVARTGLPRAVAGPSCHSDSDSPSIAPRRRSRAPMSGGRAVHREPGCETGTLLLRVFVHRRGSPVAAQCTKVVEGSRVACHVCQPCSRVQLGGRLSAS